MARIWPVRPGTDDLADACARVEPGDTIRLLAGVHRKPAVLARSGRAGHPIRIVGESGAVIDGGQEGHPDILPEVKSGGLTYPAWQDWAFLRLDNTTWVEIADLRMIRKCWPCFLHARQVTHLAIRRCSIEGGTYPLFVRDPAHVVTLSRDILVEDCFWRQDTSPDHVNWSRADWRDLHGSREKGKLFKKLRHFNGAFFGTCDIGGRVVLRRNTMIDAYNGFRLGLSQAVRELGSAAIRRRNRDIEISHNIFVRIRDNPIEPENHAHNWIVRHNIVLDCHTWFSMDAVAGGYWYFYGNVGWFRTRQGGPKSNMGKVLKFSSSDEEPVPEAPIHFFNNSWYLRCPVIAGDPPPNDYRISHLRFLNNAIQYCQPQEVRGPPEAPLPVCELGVRYMVDLRWFSTLGTLDYTICDHPCFPTDQQQHGHEGSAIREGGIFIAPADGDFRLVPGCRARGTATRLSLALPDGRIMTVHPQDRGAFQGDSLISVSDLEQLSLAAV